MIKNNLLKQKQSESDNLAERKVSDGSSFRNVVKTIKIIVSTVLVVCTLLFVFILINNRKGFLSLFKEHEEISTVVLKSELKDIAELATEKYEFTRMDDKKSSLKFFFNDDWDVPFSESKMIITYSGYVLAGVKDFSDIDIKINDKKEKIEVFVPECELLDDPYIDMSTVKIYDLDNSIFNPLPDDTQVKIIKKATDDIIEEAEDNGIIERAEEKTTNIIKSLIEMMVIGSVYEDYDIVVKFD